jgi:uncharacterized cysteine cluster protein YcgN (CxxCxxCC family)
MLYWHWQNYNIDNHIISAIIAQSGGTLMNAQNFANLEKMLSLNIDEWNAICRHCGVCCLNTYKVKDTLVYAANACEYQDAATRKCNIFDTGRALQTKDNEPICHKFQIGHIILGKSMPDSCAYVEFIFGPAEYPANVDWKQILRIENLLANDVDPLFDSTFSIDIKITKISHLWRHRYNSKQSSATIRAMIEKYGEYMLGTIFAFPQKPYKTR